MNENIDYKKIEEILFNDISNNDKKWFFNNFDNLVKLSELIIGILKTTEFENETFDYYLDINESIEKVILFLNDIDPNYGYIFQNILQEKNSGYNSIRFLKTDNIGVNRNSSVMRGNVMIEYSNNCGDIFEIVHEITHKFSTSAGETGTVKKMLGEIPSITMEFLLTDFLENETNLNEKEIKKYKIHRLCSSVDNACAILLEKILFEIYFEHKYITEDLVRKKITLLDHDNPAYSILSERFEIYLSTIVDRCCTTSIYRQRYVYGMLFAAQIHQRILENKNNINMLKQWIYMLGSGYNISSNIYNFSDENIKELSAALSLEALDISKYRNLKI